MKNNEDPINLENIKNNEDLKQVKTQLEEGFCYANPLCLPICCPIIPCSII